MSMNYTQAQVKKLIIEHKLAIQHRDRKEAVSIRSELIAFKKEHPKRYNQAYAALSRKRQHVH